MNSYFLRIPLQEFQAAVRAVLYGNFATLGLMVQGTGSRQTLIGLGPWSVGPTPLDPRRQSVFASLLTMSLGELPDLPNHVLPAQTIVHLRISREQSDRVTAVVLVGGTNYGLEKMTLVGPGMISLVKPVPWNNDSELTTNRHSRIDDIQGTSRSAWREGTIVVTGAGSGGSCLAFQLASNAPAGMILIDPDRVKLHNLDNMPHATVDDVSARRFKSYIAVQAIHRNAPDMVVQAIAKRIQTPKVQAYLRSREILAVFSFVDDLSGHLSSSILARDLLVPHIAVGTLIGRDPATNRITSQADIRLLEPRKGCIRCVPYLGDADHEAALYEMRRPTGALRRGDPVDWQSGGRIGTSLAVNQIAAGIAVDLFSRYLRGEVTTSTWTRYINTGGATELIERSVAPDSRCEYCIGQ